MGVSQSTVFRWKKKKLIRKHTNAIKPHLSDNNKVDRLIYSPSCTLNSMTNTFKFTDMSNIVQIDEKFFYITKEQQTYYLSPGEIEPHREIQSKRFIPNIIFMCAIAQHIFGTNGEVIFDEKIRIFPFTSQVPAQRKSKKKENGVLETKPIQSITKQHIRAMLIDNILPTIREKGPTHKSKTIFI